MQYPSNIVQVKIQNDGRDWRKKGWVVIDDAGDHSWKWIGGKGEPSYINDEQSDQEGSGDVATDNELRAVLRRYGGSWHDAYKIVGEELFAKYSELKG